MNTNGNEDRWTFFAATPSRDEGHVGAPVPRPRRNRSIEKDHPFNIDAQDAQDYQDGRLLRERLAPAMIACGCQVGLLIHFGKCTLVFRSFTRNNTHTRNYKPAVSRTNPVHPVHRCESEYLLMLD